MLNTLEPATRTGSRNRALLNRRANKKRYRESSPTSKNNTANKMTSINQRNCFLVTAILKIPSQPGGAQCQSGWLPATCR